MDYLEKIRKNIKHKHGNVKAAALFMGASHVFLNQVLNGNAKLSIALAYKIHTHLGLDGISLLRGQLQKEWNDYVEKEKNHGA